MPAVIAFDGDTIAQQAIAQCQRYARLAFADLAEREAETIVIVSSERLLAQVQPLLRAPNVRIIALSDARFHDPRMDGSVYGYLPANTPPSLVERMMDNALDHIHLLATRREKNERLDRATREISELNEIGAALSAEHDTDRLLEMILTKSRQITKSDAGSLYLVEEVAADHPALPPLDTHAAATHFALQAQREYGGARLVAGKQQETRRALRFKLAQNDTLGHLPFREALMEISDRSIAGYVVKTGQIVNLEDTYHLPERVPYSFNRKFDEESGYRTKSMLAVPMRNPKSGEIVGALQLINAKRDTNAILNTLSTVILQVVAYTARQQEIVASLASQAAVALDNSRLYRQQQDLFEGFITAAVTAIELRDPATSGHSGRVANGTVALAETVDRTAEGPYRDLKFNADEMKEIRYASLLHDVGKVTVREKVLVKAKKLYPEQLEMIKQRFDFVRRSMEKESLQCRLQYVLAKSRDEYLAKHDEFDAKLAQQLREMDEFFQTVEASNQPTVVPQGNFDKLLEIAARQFFDFDGNEQSLLTPTEVRLLSLRKGTLDDEERQEIESHVLHSFNFLNQIPWTKEIRSIPEIALGHHEKLNGNGYPYKLAAPDIPLQTRMMTICDIYDALVAADRPYKRKVGQAEALNILDMEVKDGYLDNNLFRLFVDAKVYERWPLRH